MKTTTALLFILLFQSIAQAESFQDLFADVSKLEDPKANMSHVAFILPNEDDFYLFDPALQGKTDVLISVGTFRSLEDTSRGGFSHALLLDRDERVVAFNLFQIDLLRRSPTRRDFILNYIGRRSVFSEHPELGALVESWRLKEAAAYIYRQDLSDIFPGDYRAQILKSEYLQKILKMSDPSLGFKAGFLGSEERYRRLHTMAREGRMAAVRADLTKESFANVGRALRENGLQVSVLDVSNAPDYFLHSEAHKNDEFRMNLQQLPFTQEAEVLFTSGMILTEKKYGIWSYVRVSARDLIFNLGALLRWGSYSMFINSDLIKSQVLEPSQPLRCRQLF